MAEVDTLQARIDAEFAADEKKIEGFQAKAVQDYEDRQKRLHLFEKTCEQLRDVWRPKLETLANRFGDRIKATPNITRELRQVTFDVESKLARVQLQFAASTDSDVRKLVLDYTLEILPIFIQFDGHTRAEFPLESVDPTEVGKWIDDRILEFVRTYLAISHNQYYLKDHMVVDPVAGVRFPKFAAAATQEHKGQTYYFISDKTRSEFAEKDAAVAAAPNGRA